MQKINTERDFWLKVDKGSGCWEWLGHKTQGGYGVYPFEGRTHTAHRLSYRFAKGPIPTGLEIDHLCRNHGCVNPDHIEAVTHRVNMVRGNTFIAAKVGQTHCIHGHLFNEKNTYIKPNGTRMCRSCSASRAKRRRDRRKASLE